MNDVEKEQPPLKGIKVVELSMYVQGPVAGLALASLGASVIKIEQVGQADYMRSFHSAFGVTFDERGKQWVYSSLNRNKRSLVLDIGTEEGKPIFQKLIQEADVFVTNLRQEGLIRYGADSKTLLAINPRLVYCRGGGFALKGELANDPCQDTVGMAFAGFMDTASPTETPNYPPGSMSDILTGTNMASAILAGLVKRSLTGVGCVVGTSQTQSLLWMQLQAVGVAVNLDQKLERFDADSGSNPLFGVYKTSDGWIAIAALQAHQWPLIAKAVGLTELLNDDRFQTFIDVLNNRDSFRQIFTPHMQKNTTQNWWQVMREVGIWVSPVNQLEDLAMNQSIIENEYLVTFDDGFMGPPTPFDVDGYEGSRGSAANYGEHTDEILEELGLTEDERLTLRISGAIW
jgi:crotonobetainyl-CoA:carnitine CoA-transferase CaiB-like acyl-CoA transferase|tara:strand:+ start:2169 stop:3374 length:1206 start_codon:yes stop_codon:yes gene_type:complete